mmetsp:Transcript_156982/g.278518  ORF Transcript_156982/g.278518 Transcript_156982/m.278518 type:complete len:478 (+) Transcript_156982:240-1673(+)
MQPPRLQLVTASPAQSSTWSTRESAGSALTSLATLVTTCLPIQALYWRVRTWMEWYTAQQTQVAADIPGEEHADLQEEEPIDDDGSMVQVAETEVPPSHDSEVEVAADTPGEECADSQEEGEPLKLDDDDGSMVQVQETEGRPLQGSEVDAAADVPGEECADRKEEFMGKLCVLETSEEREAFRAIGLQDCRVLHVKGFDCSFENPFPEQVLLEKKQREEALRALTLTAPDFIVIDGHPRGQGFQASIEEYMKQQMADGQKIPTLIWAKCVTLLGEEARLVDEEERNESLKQAQDWAAQGFAVIVYWVSVDEVKQKINELFGSHFVERTISEDDNARGLLKIISEPALPWFEGVRSDLKKRIQKVESPQRGKAQYFKKVSFENAARGNLIFDLLHNSAAALHGVVFFGGDESDLLEICTKHFNRTNQTSEVGTYPMTRGRYEEDIEIPFWCPRWVAPDFLLSNKGSSELFQRFVLSK